MTRTAPRACLDILLPMHVLVDRTGHIRHAGPTTQKLLGRSPCEKRLLEVFELHVPRDIGRMQELLLHCGEKIQLRPRNNRVLRLRGVLLPFNDTPLWILNLSFGISLFDAVQDLSLCHSDFAPTDPITEMLYLREAQSAAMSESQRLNLRLQGAKVAAEEQAYTDNLTGLQNRRAMEHILTRFITHGHRFALLQIDLDFFKSVNDTMGHAAGDAVLKEVARILREEIRDKDAAIRLGGDEFLIIISEPPQSTDLETIAGRLIKRLEVPIPFGDLFCKISGSIGITLSQLYDAPDIDTMMEDVDYALYACKRRGKRCYQLFDFPLREAFFEAKDSA